MITYMIVETELSHVMDVVRTLKVGNSFITMEMEIINNVQQQFKLRKINLIEKKSLYNTLRYVFFVKRNRNQENFINICICVDSEKKLARDPPYKNRYSVFNNIKDLAKNYLI